MAQPVHLRDYQIIIKNWQTEKYTYIVIKLGYIRCIYQISKLTGYLYAILHAMPFDRVKIICENGLIEQWLRGKVSTIWFIKTFFRSLFSSVKRKKTGIKFICETIEHARERERDSLHWTLSLQCDAKRVIVHQTSYLIKLY